MLRQLRQHRVVRLPAVRELHGDAQLDRLGRRVVVEEIGHARTADHDARVPGRVLVVVHFIAPATPSVRKTATGVRWHFSGNDMP